MDGMQWHRLLVGKIKPMHNVEGGHMEKMTLMTLCSKSSLIICCTGFFAKAVTRSQQHRRQNLQLETQHVRSPSRERGNAG